jgi:hypothetical protein
LNEPKYTRPRHTAGDEYTYAPVLIPHRRRPFVENAVSELPVDDGTKTRPCSTAGVPYMRPPTDETQRRCPARGESAQIRPP